jgi:very-short-patch-repair endonuclease
LGEGTSSYTFTLMQGPIRRKTNPYAARLRTNATEAESRLWAHLRNRQLGGFKFRFQASIGPYSVDFLCAESALIIEVDGSQHNEEVDRTRTHFLEAQGHRVLRFWNNEIFENLDGVLLTIKAACESRTWREAEE